MNTLLTEHLAFSSSVNALAILSKLVCKLEYSADGELLYCAAIEEAEERFGPDSSEVAWLLEAMADIYERKGKADLSAMYRRRADSIASDMVAYCAAASY